MLPIKTATDGALVVPLTRRWNTKGAPAPEQTKPGIPNYQLNTGNVDSVPIYPTVETAPIGTYTSQRPTILNPNDFMRGNPYE
jgi:hypothetical protein